MAHRLVLAALLAAGAAALNTPPRLQSTKLAKRAGAEPWKSVDRRQLASGIAALAGALVAAPDANAVVYLDPARYGDQELKNAAIAKCRTRVRDVIAKDPSLACSFFLLALLDGLSYDEKTRRGGPDGMVAASIQLPGRAYA